MDIESIEAARREEPEALDRLVAAVWPDAFRIALTILRDRALAEDAAQESCATVYRAIARLRSAEAFKVWFYRIVVRQATAIDRHRRSLLLAADPADVRSGLDGSLARLDVRAALARLSPIQRTTIVLHYYADLNSREISAVLSMPDSSVRFHLMRARHALERMLGDDAYVRPVLTEAVAGAV